MVFVIGLSEGIFPSQKSLLEGQKGLEEERRLAYVAYTRAEKLLYLSESSSFSYVVQSAKLASRFINEIDDEYIEHIDNKPNDTSLIFDMDIVREKPRSKANNNTRIRKGDTVIHSNYGEGIVLKADDDFLEIAFSFPHGVKKIMKGHPSIKKKKKENYS